MVASELTNKRWSFATASSSNLSLKNAKINKRTNEKGIRWICACGRNMLLPYL